MKRQWIKSAVIGIMVFLLAFGQAGYLNHAHVEAAKAKKVTYVYYVPKGYAYHRTKSCRTLSRSKFIYRGKLSAVKKLRSPCKVCY